MESLAANSASKPQEDRAAGTHPARSQSKSTGLPRSVRLPLFLVVVTGQIILLVLFLPRDPVLMQRMALLLHPRPIATPPSVAAASQNLPLDWQLPTSDTGLLVRQRAQPTKKGYVLVPVGDCAGCMGIDLAAWQHSAREQGISLVVLTSAAPKDAKKFMQTSHVDAPIISDTSGRLMELLNRAWVGRPYLFSTDWKLLWQAPSKQIQYNPMNDTSFQKALQEAQK